MSKYSKEFKLKIVLGYIEKHISPEQQEKAGKTFVICPEAPLGISRTEKDPDELQRVYDLGRAEMQKKLEELKAFLV